MTEHDDLTLRDIAQRAVDRNGGKAGRALDREAKAHGLTLSYTTVDKILAGTYRSIPKRITLDALAQLAGMDRDVVYRAAGVPVPLGRLADELPPDADLLTGPQREAVLSVVRQFAAANKALHADRLMPNTQDPEDVEDFVESEDDDELRKRRAARGLDTETGYPHGVEMAHLLQVMNEGEQGPAAQPTPLKTGAQHRRELAARVQAANATDDLDQDLEDQPADEDADTVFGETPEQIAARKKDQ